MTGLRKRRSNHGARSWVVPMAASLCTCSTYALAADVSQAGVAGDSAGLEEVIVSARKREERLIDVPVAVTEVSAQTLRQAATTSITQLGNLVPGVSMERMGGGSSGAAFTIRGVGQLAQDYNTEQPVALNIDGVQITRGAAAQIGFFDLQSLQVLKGPQALFFGKNSPAGVVAVDSVTPGSNFEGYVRTGYEFRTSAPSAEAAVSIPLSEAFSMRLAGHYGRDNSGDIENRARPIANPFDGGQLPGATYARGPMNRDRVGRITIAFRPDNGFDATLKVLGSYHHDWGGATEEVANCGANSRPTTINLLNPTQTAADPYGDCRVNNVISNGAAPAQIVRNFRGAPDDGKPFTETTAWLSSLVMNYDISPQLALTSTTGMYHYSHGAFDNYDLTVYAQALDAEHDRDTQVSQEFRLTSSFAGPLNFTTGAYYEHDEHDVYNTDKIFALGPFPGPGAYNGAYNTLAMEAKNKAESWSVFAQLSWKILDNLELAGGARYTRDTREAAIQNVFNYFDLIAPQANPFSPVGYVYTPSIDANNVSPEATLTWHPVEDITLYGAFKTAYLAAAVGNPANISNYTTLPDPDSSFIYKEEKVRGFEAGAKGLLFDGRMSAHLTLYRYEYSNLQVATFHPDTTSFYPGNAGKARNQGVEFELKYKPWRDLTLTSTLLYSDLKYLEYSAAQCYPGQSLAQCPNGSQDLSDTRYGDGPFTGRVGFSYEHPITSQLAVRVGADVLHTSEAPKYQRDPLAVTPDYNIFNASLSVFQVGGPWQFELIGTNLNNGVYYKNFIFKPLGLADDLGTQSINQARRIMARVGYEF